MFLNLWFNGKLNMLGVVCSYLLQKGCFVIVDIIEVCDLNDVKEVADSLLHFVCRVKQPAVELEKKEPTEEIDVGVNEDGAAAAGTDAAGDGAAPGSAAYSTRSKTGSIAPRNYVDMKRRESSASPATVKDEEVKKTEDTPVNWKLTN